MFCPKCSSDTMIPVDFRFPWNLFNVHIRGRKTRYERLRKQNSFLPSLPKIFQPVGSVNWHRQIHQYHQPQKAGFLTESGFCYLRRLLCRTGYPTPLPRSMKRLFRSLVSASWMRKANSASAGLSLSRVSSQKPVLRTESFPRRKCRCSRTGMWIVYARSMNRKDCFMWSIRQASSKAAVPPSVPELSSSDSEPQTGTPSQTAIGAASGMLVAGNMMTPATSSIRPGAILKRLRRSWQHHALKATGNGDGRKSRASAESLRSGTASLFTPIPGISRKKLLPNPQRTASP